MEQFQSAVAASRQKRLPMAAIPFTSANDQLAGIRCVSFCVPVARQANVHKVARPVERCCQSRLQAKPRQARPGKIRILYTISGIRARRGSCPRRYSLHCRSLCNGGSRLLHLFPASCLLTVQSGADWICRPKRQDLLHQGEER